MIVHYVAYGVTACFRVISASLINKTVETIRLHSVRTCSHCILYDIGNTLAHAIWGLEFVTRNTVLAREDEPLQLIHKVWEAGQFKSFGEPRVGRPCSTQYEAL